MLRNPWSRRAAALVVALAVSLTAAFALSSLAQAAEPYVASGTIDNANPSGTSVTRDEFILLCPQIPASQGLDAWIFELPDGTGVAGATAALTAANATGAYDLTASVWLNDCTFDNHYDDSASDVSVTLPAGTRFIAAVTATGSNTTVTLTVTPPVSDPAPSITPTPSPTGTAPATARGTYPLEPNDPLFPAQDVILGGQWGMRKIQAPQAWQLGQSTGYGITVAVIDTGLDLDHPDFACEGKLKLIPDSDFVGDGNGPQDGNGHGTHVSGIVAACTNNNEGVVGVAPDAAIMPLQVLDAAGNGDVTATAPAIRAATDAGAHVINMSLGGLPGLGTVDTLIQLFPEIDAAVEYAVSRGVVIVASAGNDSFPMCGTPAVAEDIICVGASDTRDLNAYYSNFPVKDDTEDTFGPAVLAPGGSGQVFCDFHAENIVSTYLVEADGCDEGYPGYLGIDGTSMASPHVAGVAALVYDRLGGVRSAENGRKVIDAIITTAVDLYGPGYDPLSGFGRVDALGAVGGVDVSPAPQVESTTVRLVNPPTSGQFTDTIDLSARLADSTGVPLADQPLSFQLLGRDGFREIAATTGADGVASAALLLDAPPGAYDVIAAYAGKKDTYASSTDRAAFALAPEDSTTTLTVEGRGGKRTLRAKLFDSDTPDRGVPEGRVSFYADGEHIGDAYTDATGVAVLEGPPGARGASRTYEARFAGNSFFLGSSS